MSRGYLQIVQLNTDCKNGKVYVYLAGGTNLAEIYDPVSGDEITNPVNINSLGYCDAFLVDTATLYDIKVVDFLGAPKLTRMNVSVIGGGAGTAGPQGNQGRPGDKGDKGDKGDTGAAGTNGTNGTNGTDGTDGVSLLNIRVDETSSTGRVIYTKSDDPNNWIEAGDIMPAGIGQIKTTGLDTLGYLDEKIEVTGTGLGLSNTNNKITLENSAPETYKTQASQYATVKDFLNVIIEGTSGITVSTSADFNKIVLSGAGIGGSGFTPRGAWDIAVTYNEGDGVWYYDDTVSPIINRYYVATATTTGVNPYTVGTGWIIMFSIDQLGDQMVKLDAADSATSFLLDKIKAGDGIVFTRTVDAGGDYITVSGQQVFSVTTTNGTYTIDGLSNEIKFREGVWTNPAYVGTEIAIDHKSIAQMEGQTTPMFTASGLPKFDDYGHYMNASDPIEISDVAGLADAIVAAGDGKVKIDADDTKDYLINKLSAGTGINITDVGNTLEISADLAESSSFLFKSNYNNAGNSGYVAIDQVVFGSQFIDAPNHKIQNLPLGKLLLSTNLKATSNFGNFDYSEDCYSGTTGTQVYIIGENNPLVKFGSNQFGTWTEYQSKSTGYSSQPFWSGYTRRVVEVAGKQLVNLGCNLYSKQNGNGGVTLYLKHYNSLGTLKTNYPVDEGDWTNLNYQEPSLAQYRQLSKSFVIDCEESDYFSVELRVRGDGANNTDIMSGSYVKNITLNGALLSGNQYNFPIAQVNTFVTQYSSSGAVKNYYDHKYAFSEYTNESSCKTYLIDMAVGDYITLTYSAGSYVADVQYEVHGFMCVGTKGDAGIDGIQGPQGPAGTVANLDAIPDVNVANVTDKQVLTYDQATNTWIAGACVTTDPTLDGLQSYPIILTNGSINTGHTSDQGATYTSSRVIPSANVEANFISCFITQYASFYGLRMGIYLPGAAGDTLIAQTANINTPLQTGLVTLSLAYDADGNLLTNPLVLSPNTSYLLSAVIKANGCQFAAYTGIATNQPNHFGRQDGWNAPAPTNLMDKTAGYTQTSQFIWMSVSK